VKLLLATTNSGKIREISRILKGLSLEEISLRDIENIKPAHETGKSFTANARIKAKTYFRQTRLLTLAEDSGLQVDCLGGEPGVLSARFAGKDASDSDNLKELLGLMRGVKTVDRTARFVCIVAITDGKRVWIVTGKCEGRIAAQPSGNSGFGYDPVFIPEGYNTTFARLGTRIKNKISHRAQALGRTRHILEKLLAEDSE
jgi:XTP/dITP diphosphohydrolase